MHILVTLQTKPSVCELWKRDMLPVGRVPADSHDWKWSCKAAIESFRTTQGFGNLYAQDAGWLVQGGSATEDWHQRGRWQTPGGGLERHWRLLYRPTQVVRVFFFYSLVPHLFSRLLNLDCLCLEVVLNFVICTTNVGPSLQDCATVFCSALMWKSSSSEGKKALALSSAAMLRIVVLEVARYFCLPICIIYVPWQLSFMSLEVGVCWSECW